MIMSLTPLISGYYDVHCQVNFCTLRDRLAVCTKIFPHWLPLRP